MIETAVLDETKPYHHLFSDETKRHARETMDAFYAKRSQSSSEDGNAEDA